MDGGLRSRRLLVQNIIELMKASAFYIGLLCSVIVVRATIIPADRLAPWQGNVGVTGSIPNYTNIAATLSPSGDATIDTAAINAALDDAPTNSVVKLKAGTFLINDAIEHRSGRVLRGTGLVQTKLRFDAGDILMRSGYCQDCLLTNACLLSADATRGSTTITPAGGVPSWIRVGETYGIDMLDDEVAASGQAAEGGAPNTYRKAVGYGVREIDQFATTITGWTLAAGSPASSSVVWNSTDAFGSPTSGSLKLTGNFAASGSLQTAGAHYVFASPLNFFTNFTRFYLYFHLDTANSTIRSAGDYGNLQVTLYNGAGATPVTLTPTKIVTGHGQGFWFINTSCVVTNDVTDVRSFTVQLSQTNYAGPVVINLDYVFAVGDRTRNNLFKVAAKTSTDITTELPLIQTWSTNRYAQVWKAGYDPDLHDQFKNGGIEDLTMEATYGNGDVPFVKMESCQNSWIKNVRMKNIPGRDGVVMYWGYRNSVVDSFIDDSHFYGAGQAYGVNLYTGTTYSLVQNNIVKRMHVALSNNYGASGNVIAYNYVLEEHADQPKAVSISAHAATPTYDLAEGNYIEGDITADDVHGGSWNLTYFRNRALGYSFGRDFDQTPVSLEKWARQQNVVGNVLGVVGLQTNLIVSADTNWGGLVFNVPVFTNGCDVVTVYKFGFASDYGCGNDGDPDTQAESAHIIHGNWDVVSNGVVWDAGIADHSLPNSLYLSAKPAWWDDGAPWPPVEPTTTTTGNINAITIPAKLRYEREFVPPNYLSSRSLGKAAQIVKTAKSPKAVTLETPVQVSVCNGPQATPILHESFDPAGYDSSWTTALGTPNPDFTVTVLAGTQSLKLTGAAAAYKSSASGSDRWIYCIARVVGGLPDASDDIVLFQTSGFAVLGAIGVTDGGQWRISHGSVLATGGSLAGDTTYHLWAHYIAGSGTDGEMDLFVARSPSRPRFPTISIRTGTATGNSAIYQLQTTFAINRDLLFDNFVADDEEICSNPF
jgi:hypothetical protein